MKKTISHTKKGKAAGSLDIVTEMLKAYGNIGEQMITGLIIAFVKECSVPNDWSESVIKNAFKGKGDVVMWKKHR